MKVLVTGASGFIGVHLIRAACVAFGTDSVIAFSSNFVSPCSSIKYNKPDFNLNEDDYALLATADVLVHLGAFIPKSNVQANAVEECNENIKFTAQLLALPFNCLKKIIYISTVDVYEPSGLISESTPTVPTSLYGWSKLYCEQMISAYSSRNGICCQILRIGHVYGPGEEKYEKFLPKAIRNILDGNSVDLWGDGSDIRSFIYIDDVVSSILHSIGLSENLGPINVVSGNAISIKSLLDKIIEVSAKPVNINKKEFLGHSRNYIFDNSKLLEYLLPKETELKVGLIAEYKHMEEI